MHALVDLGTQARDLAFRDAGHAHGLDEVVDRARRDALHIGLLDDGSERLLGGAPRLQEGWKVRALPELRDGELDRPGARLPGALAIAVALIDALRRAFAMGGADEAFDVHVHHAVGEEGDHLPEEIGVRALFNELFQDDPVDGHGIRLSVCPSSAPRTNLSRPMTASSRGPGAVDGSS